jgi:FAD/FMN-containing dehydrogenase
MFNQRVAKRKPAAVLLAADEDDVVAGVRLAARNCWQVSVRAGGHCWANWGIRDNALLIDLGAMKDMRFDPATNIATVTPAVAGATELDPFLAERGRFFPVGHCESVGLGGFLLQGDRDGIYGTTGGLARASNPSTWCSPTAARSGRVPTRIRICSGWPAAQDRVSPESSRGSI